MSSKAKNLKKNNLKEMSMPDFLYNFCGITDINVFKMTHFDVGKLIPELKRCSFETAYANPRMIYNGTIILVRDFKKNLAPYFNPLRNEIDFEFRDLRELEKPERKMTTTNTFGVDELNNYELKMEYKAQKDSKLKGKYKLCRILKKEMQERGIERSGRKRILVQDARYLEGENDKND